MTERHESHQNGPVDVKTDKDSRYRSQEHTEADEVQNEAPLSDLEDLKTNYVDMYVHRQLPNYAPIMRLVSEAERQFEHSLRKVKAKAWDEGWVGGACTPGQHPRESNPYKSEEA
ncbi:MAG: hypothetical protein SOH95_02535 [Bifidobacterium crudilactis]|jgi:hypothetical protein